MELEPTTTYSYDSDAVKATFPIPEPGEEYWTLYFYKMDSGDLIREVRRFKNRSDIIWRAPSEAESETKNSADKESDGSES